MSGLSGLVIKRIAMGFLTIFVISVLIFVGVEALPGDLATAILGQEATPETVAQFRKELKLDEPPVKRYFLWLGAFMRGDLGNSLANKRPVAELIVWRFKNTIFLAASAAVIAVPVAIILGILAALYRNSLFDRFISMATLSTISFPQHQRFDVLRTKDFCDCPSLSDTDAGCLGPHDAPDARGNYQHPGQSLYRNGQAKGYQAPACHRRACLSECAFAGDQCGGAESGVSGCRRGDR
jgi:hypothetical protein